MRPKRQEDQSEIRARENGPDLECLSTLTLMGTNQNVWAAGSGIAPVSYHDDRHDSRNKIQTDVHCGSCAAATHSTEVGYGHSPS